MPDFLKNTVRSQDIESQKKTNPIKDIISKGKSKISTLPSSYVGHNTGIGDSRFDEGLRVETNLGDDFQLDLEDYRSKSQSRLEKTAKGLGRVVNKVGVELAKMPGYLVGGAGALGNEIFGDGEGSMEMFVNNAWINKIQDYEDWTNNEVLPVYVKKSVREGDIWNNLSSIDFWSTEGADGLAFMLSMIAPSVAISKANLGAKMIAGLGSGEKTLNMVSKMDKAAKALGLESAGGAIDLGTSTLVNTMFEAGSEANGAMNALERKPDESEEEFMARKGQVGRDVFMSNVGILMLPNMILNKQIMNVGKKPSRFKVVNNEITSALEKKSFKDKAWDWTSKVLAPNIAREGFFEEGMQSAVEEYWRHNEEFDTKKLLETYLDVIGSTEGQKAVFLGSLFGTGATTVGNYNQSKRNKKSDNDVIDTMNSSISFYEKSKDGFEKKDSDGNIILDENGEPQYDYGKLVDQAKSIEAAQENYQKLQLAKVTGNKETYDILNDQLETSLLSTFIKSGEDGLTVLEQKLKELDGDINTSDIMSKAAQVLKDYEFFNNYGKILSGVKVDMKNRDIYNRFISNLENIFLQTKSQQRLVNNKIQMLQNDLSSLVQNINEDSEDYNEYKTITDNIEKLIGEYQKYKIQLKSQIKDILDSKKQKEAFTKYKEENEQVEEATEKLQKEKEEGLSVEQEKKFEENKKSISKEQSKESQEEEQVKVAKDETNKFYDALDELYNNYDKYDLIKDKEGEVSSFTETSHLNVLKPFINRIKNSDNIYINKVLDDDGNEVYDITIKNERDGNFEKIRVEKFNVPEEEEQTLPTSEDSVNNNDSQYDSKDNEETNESIVNNEKKVFKPKQHVKLVNSSDPLMSSENYKIYIEQPRNKKDENVTFTLGYSGTNEKAKEATSLFNNIIENNFDISKDQKDFLIKHLPIKVNFNEEVFTHLFNEDGSGNYKLDAKEIELRTNIVNKALDNSELNNISSKISFQYPGKIQLDRNEDGLPADNNILEIQQFEKLSDVKFVYSDSNGYIKNIDKTSNANFSDVKHPGSIFVEVKMANGRLFPLKLNTRRINDTEADIILKLTQALITDINIKYKTNISKSNDILQLTDEELDYIKKEAKAMNINMNSLNIGQLFRDLIFEGNSKKNKFKIQGNNLLYGTNRINKNSFETNREDIKQWLTNNKNRNITVSKLNQNPYKQHVIDNIAFTDVILGDNIFKENTDVYINSIINEEVTKKTKEEVNKKINTLKKKKKSRGKKLRDIKKSISDMKKDNDQNSNTIC